MVALIDFGNTLADETFMRRDSAAFPSWTAEYLSVVSEVRGSWDIGQVRYPEVAAAVALRLGAATEDVVAHMVELCRSIDLFPGINAAVAARRARGGIQALVTVNPDLFAEVCSHYGLVSRFDAIVTSWEAGTDNKVALCQRALEILGVDNPGQAVLIDNLSENVDRWMDAGGIGYVFDGDQSFVTDVRANRVPGFIPADAASTPPAT